MKKSVVLFCIVSSFSGIAIAADDLQLCTKTQTDHPACLTSAWPKPFACLVDETTVRQCVRGQVTTFARQLRSTPEHWVLSCRGAGEIFRGVPVTEFTGEFDVDFGTGIVSAQFEEKSLPPYEPPIERKYNGRFLVDESVSGLNPQIPGAWVFSVRGLYSSSVQISQYLNLRGVSVVLDATGRRPISVPQGKIEALYSHEESYDDRGDRETRVSASTRNYIGCRVN